MECCYCKKYLKTVSSLKYHQRTAKYCLKLRGSVCADKFFCRCCNKGFMQKIHLRDHMYICKENTVYIQELKQENREFKNTIICLKNKVKTYEERVKTLEQEKKDIMKELLTHSETIAKQPRYTQNKINITHNLAVFNKTDDDIQKLVYDEFNKAYLIKGQKGAAEFANTKIINNGKDGKPIYIITDRTRGNGRYRTSDNETVIDNGMIGLTDKVMPSMKRKAAVIYMDEFGNNEIAAGYNDLVQDDMSDFRNEMIKLHNSLENQNSV
jgi:hypothetical protein